MLQLTSCNSIFDMEKPVFFVSLYTSDIMIRILITLNFMILSFSVKIEYILIYDTWHALESPKRKKNIESIETKWKKKSKISFVKTHTQLNFDNSVSGSDIVILP